MKKETKKNKAVDSNSKKGETKEIVKPIDFDKDIDSLPTGDPIFRKVAKKEKKHKRKPEEIPLEEVLGIEIKKDDRNQVSFEQANEISLQPLEQTIKEEYPEQFSSDSRYSGSKEKISYNSVSSTGTTSYNTNTGDSYKGSNTSGYTSNQDQQGGSYDQRAGGSHYELGSATQKERVGEIRGEKTSVLESKFLTMAKNQSKSDFQSQQHY